MNEFVIPGKVIQSHGWSFRIDFVPHRPIDERVQIYDVDQDCAVSGHFSGNKQAKAKINEVVRGGAAQ